MEYARRTVDGELDDLMRSLPAIALEGAKGVGKTETATRRAASSFLLDEGRGRELLDAEPERVLAAEPPVLIDEWQHVPDVWDRVRRSVDAGAEAGRYLLTGSSAPSGLGTHSGAGRIVSLRMRPLSLAERLADPPAVSLAALLSGRRGAVVGETAVGLEDYTREIVRSGFPGLRGFEHRALRAQLDGYVRRVVDRDFPELGHAVRNPTALLRWMRAFAAATSTVTSFEKIRAASTAGVGPAPPRSTVQPYRDVLERLFILDAVPAWRPSRNRIAELGQPPKHHLADPALAAQLLGASEDALLSGEAPGPLMPRDGTLLGALFESLVTLSVQVYAQANEARVGHLRTHRGEHEVDLIVERADGRVVAIEVKLGRNPGVDAFRHLTWLTERIGDELLDAVVVTSGTDAYRREDGIAVVPAALLGP